MYYDKSFNEEIYFTENEENKLSYISSTFLNINDFWIMNLNKSFENNKVLANENKNKNFNSTTLLILNYLVN